MIFTNVKHDVEKTNEWAWKNKNTLPKRKQGTEQNYGEFGFPPYCLILKDCWLFSGQRNPKTSWMKTR